jgi:uncharacterized protein (DUF2267 family)
MYVSRLFEIARLAGLSQQDVIKDLGLRSHVPTVLWAGGKRPMPDKHLKPLIALLERTCARKAAALPADQAQAFDAQVTQLLADWVEEVRERRGSGQRAAIRATLQRLSVICMGKDARTFDEDLMKEAHRQELYHAVNTIKQCIETLDRVLPTEEAEVEQLAKQFKAPHKDTPRLRATLMGLDPGNTNAP